MKQLHLPFKTLALWLLCLGIAPFLPAQTVTQSWAALASTAFPEAIAVDASGNVYTANYSNNTVSKITSAGVVTQSWAALASGAGPRAIAIDASGNVYTANDGNNTVSKITSAGVVTQSWAALASTAHPDGIAVDALGNVYTANYSNNTVSKITSSGTVTRSWAALASGAGPYAIAIDASGNVYTANYDNNTVSKITSSGTVTQSWAALASGAGPEAIAIDAAGNVYTANYLGKTVSKITSAGVVTQSWAALASQSFPTGIAITTSGNVYTANNTNNTVSKITGAAALPVELVSFSGKTTEGGNLLTWETANEVNNKGFEIERLAPPTPQRGENWENIGFVAAKGKSATYQFTDNLTSARFETSPTFLTYYRLRQIDNDGTETLSKTISIESKGTKGKLAVYPNPVSTHLTIEGIARNEATEGSDFQIFNLLGQQVLTGKTPSVSKDSFGGGRGLDVSALPQGSYVLKMGTEQVKFIKQ